jgi:hypothetical protein
MAFSQLITDDRWLTLPAILLCTASVAQTDGACSLEVGTASAFPDHLMSFKAAAAYLFVLDTTLAYLVFSV